MAEPAPTFPVDLGSETADKREVRLAWERARLAEAEEDLAAGRYIEGDEAVRWLENELVEVQRAFERETE